MQIPTKPVALALLGGAAFMLPAAGIACSLVPVDALLLKKAMAKEIAFRLAIDVEQVPLTDISPPELYRPWELGEDCSGLAAWHHSAGFRIAVVPPPQPHVFATMGKPHTATGAASRYRDRVFSGFYNGLPWAGMRSNVWRAPKAKVTPGGDYSGYIRWPQYPTEREAAAAVPDANLPYRWPQYPDESGFRVQGLTRWSTMGVVPAKPAGQGLCRYEGVAVVLGYDASSPVAVHFRQHCD